VALATNLNKVVNSGFNWHGEGRPVQYEHQRTDNPSGLDGRGKEKHREQRLMVARKRALFTWKEKERLIRKFRRVIRAREL